MKVTENAIEEIGTDYLNLPTFEELLTAYDEM